MRVNFAMSNYAMGNSVMSNSVMGNSAPQRADFNKTNLQDVAFCANPERMLARTKAFYNHALTNGYALPAFNVNDLANIKSISRAIQKTKSPVVIQASKGARDYAGMNYLVAMVKEAKKEAKGVPVMLHLDHGDSFKVCKECIDGGFDSVMIDGSKHALEENIRLTKEVVDYAHAKGVFVEAELGKLAGVEDAVSNKTSKFTDPQEAARFVKETGCDSLAISIGTSHGAVKFRPDEKPQLDFNRLKEIKKAVEEILPENIGKKHSDPTWRQFPFVLHGASSAPKDLVAGFNQSVVMPRNEFENLIKSAKGLSSVKKAAATVETAQTHAGNNIGKGVPEKMYSRAVKLGIAKVNVDTDFRLAYMGTMKNVLAAIDPVDKKAIDPRTYGVPVMDALEAVGARKTEMLNSAGQAGDAMKAARLGSKLNIVSS